MERVVLIVAGLDPSGGAGLVADVATVRGRGLRAAAIATALTVQDTARTEEVQPIDPSLVGRQLRRLVEDLPIAAVKLGMLGDGGVAHAVAEGLAPLAAARVPIVLDPVLHASSGAALFLGDPVAELAPLLSMAALVTPNAPEAERLIGISIVDERTQAAAARALRERSGARAVLVKGGHVPGERVGDLLDDGGAPLWLRGARQPGPTPHGTGCALSSEIACLLAEGRPLREAVTVGRDRLVARIATARAVGRGRPLLGPAGGERD